MKTYIKRNSSETVQSASKYLSLVRNHQSSDDHNLTNSCCGNSNDDRFIQRKSNPNSEVQDIPEIVRDVVSSPGLPLDESTRTFHEAITGYDFSHIRVHNDYAAEKSAEMLSAKAYTTGKNIVFGSGEYNPHTITGQALIAHELTHVMQQTQYSTPLYNHNVIHRRTERSSDASFSQQEEEAKRAEKTILDVEQLTLAYLNTKQVQEIIRNTSRVTALTFDLSNTNNVSAAYGPVNNVAKLFGLDKKLDEQLKLDEEMKVKNHEYWLIYKNDGGPPYNPGGGSDQGPTAHLSVAIVDKSKNRIFDEFGIVLTDMTTPKGTINEQELNPSRKFDSSYVTPPGGPYSNVTAPYIRVQGFNNGKVKISQSLSLGIDSSTLGKAVQDMIHIRISNSPLFPWPKDVTKLYLQGTTTYDVNLGNLTFDLDNKIFYNAQINANVEIIVGSKSTGIKAGLNAQSPLGDFNVPFLGRITLTSSNGVLVSAGLKYNDGAPIRLNAELGATTNFELYASRINSGLRIGGSVTRGNSPELLTDNNSNDRPLACYLPNAFCSFDAANAHSVGEIGIFFRF